MVAACPNLAGAFEARAEEYARHAVVHRRILQRLVSFVDAGGNDGGLWLDVGCGPGLLGEIIAGEGRAARIAGVDLVYVAACEALRTGRYRGAVIGSAGLLPVKNAGVRIAVFSAVAQWIADPAAALREVRRVLAPGGQALISVFINGSFAELTALQEDFGIATPAHYPDPEEFRGFVREAGFAIHHAEVMEEKLHFRTARRAVGHYLALGATALIGARLGGDRLGRLCSAYYRRFRTAWGVPVTYRALLAAARPL